MRRARLRAQKQPPDAAPHHQPLGVSVEQQWARGRGSDADGLGTTIAHTAWRNEEGGLIDLARRAAGRSAARTHLPAAVAAPLRAPLSAPSPAPHHLLVPFAGACRCSLPLDRVQRSRPLERALRAVVSRGCHCRAPCAARGLRAAQSCTGCAGPSHRELRA